MKNRVFLITLENLENRYSTQWRKWIKHDLYKEGIKYMEINGNPTTDFVTGGNFLNPNLSSIWKAEQTIKIAKLFENKLVQENDIFLFYDAWDWNVIALRYMSILNEVPVKIFGMWHAGSYDENDLLGQKDYNGSLLSFEKSLVQNLDKSFVATKYHKYLMMEILKFSSEKIIITGFPYNFNELNKYQMPSSEKEDIIVFPHRMSKEKNPELLKDIEKYIDGEVIFCQEKSLSKDDYHKLLAKSKIVFSASTQETWGIGIFEGMYLGCVPVIPNRLSYFEMYFEEFKYFISLGKPDISLLIKRINYILKNYENYINLMKKNIIFLKKQFCTFDNILNEIKMENYNV